MPTADALLDCEGRTLPGPKPGPGLDGIDLDLAAGRADDAVRELHARLCAARPACDRGLLLHDLMARHALGSHCLDSVIALAHARTLAVDEILVTAGRSSRGVWFDEQHPAIRLVILIAVPVAAIPAYLRCTVDLVRRLRDPALVRGLLDAPTAERFRAVWSGLPRAKENRT